MIPTRSQVNSYTTEHLTDAASFWTRTADTWEESFHQVNSQMHNLGWEGAGAEAAMQQTHSDYARVAGHADQLRVAANIARRSADELNWAHREVVNAVTMAEDEKFEVGETWHVTDRSGVPPLSPEGIARQAQAQSLSATIRAKVGNFMAQETIAGTHLADNATFVGTPPFSPTSGVQMVDFTSPGPNPVAPWDTPDQPAPVAATGPSVLSNYPQSVVGPSPQPVPGPPIPSSPPSPTSGPNSPACQGKIEDQQDQRWQDFIGSTVGGAVAGGVVAGVPTDGAGAVQGALGGALMGGVADVLNEARQGHELPKECQ